MAAKTLTRVYKRKRRLLPGHYLTLRKRENLTRGGTACRGTCRICHRHRRNRRRHRPRPRTRRTRNDGNDGPRPPWSQPHPQSFPRPLRPPHPWDPVKTCGRRPTVRSRMVAAVAVVRATPIGGTVPVAVRSHRPETPAREKLNHIFVHHDDGWTSDIGGRTCTPRHNVI